MLLVYVVWSLNYWYLCVCLEGAKNIRYQVQGGSFVQRNFFISNRGASEKLEEMVGYEVAAEISIESFHRLDHSLFAEKSTLLSKRIIDLISNSKSIPEIDSKTRF